MEITIDMPVVGDCSVDACAYNHDSRCHAKAITVGDSVRPGCDTFMDGGRVSTTLDSMAGVGACKVTGCSHNSDLECTADSIEVGLQNQTANCMTYSPQ